MPLSHNLLYKLLLSVAILIMMWGINSVSRLCFLSIVVCHRCRHMNLHFFCEKYEPAFDWENERSLIFGQRVPERLPAMNNRLVNMQTTALYLPLFLAIFRATTNVYY
jgi:hypothetical protein